MLRNKYKIKLTPPKVKNISVKSNAKPHITDSDGRVFYEMKPIKYEA